MHRAALSIFRSLPGNQDHDLATVLKLLAGALYHQGKLAEAETNVEVCSVAGRSLTKSLLPRGATPETSTGPAPVLCPGLGRAMASVIIELS